MNRFCLISLRLVKILLINVISAVAVKSMCQSDMFKWLYLWNSQIPKSGFCWFLCGKSGGREKINAQVLQYRQIISFLPRPEMKPKTFLNKLCVCFNSWDCFSSTINKLWTVKCPSWAYKDTSKPSQTGKTPQGAGCRGTKCEILGCT